MKKVIILLFKKITNIYWKQMRKNTPIVELHDKHIKNTKILLNREKLLSLLPKNGVVCELGVDMGCFSKKIIDINNPKKLHLVDIWESKRYNNTKKIAVETLFKKQIKDKKIKIHNTYSVDAVAQFDDNYFDWIYIDTNHSYATTAEELFLYSKKIKPNGIISGHDFIVGNWNGMVRYGVMEAVYEFCVCYNWELMYLTMELGENPSFAIRRMN